MGTGNGPPVLQKSQQVPATGSLNGQVSPSTSPFSIPNRPSCHLSLSTEKSQVLCRSGERAGGDTAPPPQASGEDEASKLPAQGETGWLGGESKEPGCLGSSQIKCVHCLLAASQGLHDQGSMTLSLNLCRSHQPPRTHLEQNPVHSRWPGSLCSKAGISLQVGPALFSMAAPAPAGRI